jgi:uncharacterized membrane protein
MAGGLTAALQMGGMAGAGMGGWMVFVPLVALLTVAALLAAGVVGLRALTTETDGESTSSEPEETPIDRLKRRYAEGELTEAEFERALDRELEREGPAGVEPEPAAEEESTDEPGRRG